jgi:hypothetical protein
VYENKERLMSTPPAEQPSSPSRQDATSRVRYVEELASADDAWVTITDAARITRTSEAMARRWVASGRLAIKQQPGGINQRTRLVRLSDVAAIRPIIDPTAAISEEIHKLDLPSIPRQQAHLMQEHARLLQQVRQEQQAVTEIQRALQEEATHLRQVIDELRQGFARGQEALQHQLTHQRHQSETLASQVRNDILVLEQATNELRVQELQLRRDMEQWRVAVVEQFKAVQAAVEQQLTELTADQHQQRELLRATLTTLLEQQHARVQDVLTVMGETLTRLHQDQDHLQHDLETQQQALVLVREDLTAQVEKQESMIKQAFEQQVGERARLVDRLAMMEQWREQLEAQVSQQRIDAQEQQIQNLTRLLQEERSERDVLNERLASQQKQIHALQHDIERVQQRHT